MNTKALKKNNSQVCINNEFHPIKDSLGRAYDPSNPNDMKQYRLIQRRVTSEEKRRGQKITGPYEREINKSIAHSKINQGATDAERYNGVLMLIQAHYNRSLAFSIKRGDHKKHPSFNEYAAFYDRDNIVEDLRPYLDRDYPYRPGVIAKGETNWYPLGR